MARGILNDRVQSAALQTLRRPITQEELRLMPYVHYVMMNDQRIQPTHINAEERVILAKWREEGWIEGGAGGVSDHQRLLGRFMRNSVGLLCLSWGVRLI